jgi:hypothetical protein
MDNVRHNQRIKVVLAAASVFFIAFLGTYVSAGEALLQPIPPTQMTGEHVVSQITDLVIYAGNNGTAMVSYTASATISSGVSRIAGLGYDAGIIAGSMVIRVIDGECNIESIITKGRSDANGALNWSVQSTSGGKSSYSVSYMTSSISWGISGYMAAKTSMTADIALFLDICNSGNVDYIASDFRLFGQGGGLPAAPGSSLKGSDIWEMIKPVGSDIDLAAGVKLSMPLVEVKDLEYRAYAGGSISSSMKANASKPTTKEAIQLSIFVETAQSQLLMGLPTNALTLIIYRESDSNEPIPIRLAKPESITLAEGKLTVNIGPVLGITAEIEKLDSKIVGTSSFEESFRIRIKSSSEYSSDVLIGDTFPGDWELISYTGAEWKKTNNQGVNIKLALPAKSTVDTMYKVRYTYTR